MLPFELAVARKYLVPRKKQLSVSLIALMSIGVISLVVWLLLLFLSVTEGIERSWLEKLTSLNAPVKITPTPEYYNSYYYHIDNFASASNYAYKTIGEKLQAEISDPYAPEEDLELPANLPAAEKSDDGEIKDPVKGAFAALEELQSKRPDLAFQDYEVTGALMRLELTRPRSAMITVKGDRQESVLSQVSYLATAADQSPYLSGLIQAPSKDHLNHFFYLANLSADFQKRAATLFDHVTIQKMQTSRNLMRLPHTFFKEGDELKAQGFFHKGELTHLFLSTSDATEESERIGRLLWADEGLVFKADNEVFPLYKGIPILGECSEPFNVSVIEDSLLSAQSLSDILFKARVTIQGQQFTGDLAWDGLEIAQADVRRHFDAAPQRAPPWAYFVKNQLFLPMDEALRTGILLPKNFQDSGVKLGDGGGFSFGAQTASSVQEQRVGFYVAGFYDPGILAVGNRCALVSSDVVRTISSASHFAPIERSQANGIQVWVADLSQTNKVRDELQTAFAAAGIDKYWKVTTFREYDFAKDLLQQFESDRYLFSLIGIIILIVGCSNIISLLVLLVNDKRREIGILQSMGASRFSIASIFGVCGITMGLISGLIGTFAALFTLHHIDGVVSFLSFIQGQEAFNAMFYGSSLPNTLSMGATKFILIATPILSLCAGLIPAIKACRLQPSSILREP